MIWKNIRNKRKWELNPEYQTEGNQKLVNPARGWYAIYTFSIEDKINPEELKWSLRDGESLALLRIDISSYRSKELDQQAVSNLKRILQFFDHCQRDVILRVVYDLEGKGIEQEPEEFKIVLMHLKQIGEVLKQGDHSVFLVQGLLVGSWGEMHDSKYLSKKHLIKMRECFKPYLGKDIYLAVRTPAQWRMLAEENEQNLCVFDDAIFGSSSHLGTFGTMTREAAGWENPWNSTEERLFLNKICDKLPCGGEALLPSDGKKYTDKEFVRQIRQMHLIYLNAVYDQRLLDIWRKHAMKESRWKTLFDYIGDHLGYRFVAENIEITKMKRKELWIQGVIKNVGFGTLVQDAQLMLIVEVEENKEEYIADIDLCNIKGDTKQEFTVKIKPQKARLYLKIQRKKDQRTIYFANENAADKLYIGYLQQN